jgi:uncharacterized protein (TIGR00299 family) protein
LVEAEGEAHGVPAKNVHLHEAGAADAIADVVGVCLALHALRPDRIVVSPMTTGSGTVTCAHGLYPVPGPATSLLLRGAPLTGIDAAGERLTPTRCRRSSRRSRTTYGGPPRMTLLRVGHGAGTRDYPERPNVVRALFGEGPIADRAAAAAATPTVHVVEFTVDDATPQVLAYAIERLFAAGAIDAHTTPVHMKKGRVGHQVTALAHAEQLDDVARIALTETTTLGLRIRRDERLELDRTVERVATPYGAIRIKVGWLDGVEVHAMPEYEDCAAAARKRGVALFGRSASRARRTTHRETRRREAGAMSRKPFYVTTPIYYVNDEPHIGHTYTTVVADTVARYRRATGWDVRFLTGTDEHGLKIERAAAKLGVTPIALADRVVSRYRELWKRLSISHDDFIRTTEPRHRLGVDRLIERMTAAGDVYRGSYGRHVLRRLRGLLSRIADCRRQVPGPRPSGRIGPRSLLLSSGSRSFRLPAIRGSTRTRTRSARSRGETRSARSSRRDSRIFRSRGRRSGGASRGRTIPPTPSMCGSMRSPTT